MKKSKTNDIIKVVVAAVLSISLFSAAFLGINNLAFAAATNKTEGIPAVLAPANRTAIATETNTTRAATQPSAEAANHTAAAVAPANAVAATAAGRTATAGNPAHETAANTPDNATDITLVSEAATSHAATTESTEAAGIPAAQKAPRREYQQPDMTVYQQHNEWYTPSANALTYEEAAEIGARYIWYMFGESIDGKTVQMNYSSWPSHTRAYWGGSVGNSKENLDTADVNFPDNYEPLFSFMICAVSGEWIDITNYQSPPMADDRVRRLYKAIGKLSHEESEEIQRQRYAYPAPARLEEYTQAALHFADKHFDGAEAIDIELAEFSAYGSYDLDENGDIIVVPAKSLTFEVTSSAGRIAEVAINTKTTELLYIITQHNDIVPGYSYDVPGGVG